jgi:hypothetical protein
MSRAVSSDMRPHLVSKVLSLYDRVAHHRPKRAPDVSQVADIADATSDEDAGVDVDVDIDIDVAADSAQLDIDEDSRTTSPMAAVSDHGVLYGVHTPPASDRDITDNDAAFDSGENWTEALEARAAEGGPEPEHEIDVFDEADDTHPHSATKDRPIADLGSGGRGGL